MKQEESTSLSSKVLDWLDRQGYALEMRAALAFGRAGFEVSLSQNYLDPTTNELREIDVVASLSRSSENVSASVKLFIECKYAKRPWVTFTSKKTSDRFSYFSRILGGKYDVFRWDTQSTLQARLLAHMLSSFGRETLLKYASFLVPESVGYRVTEALGDSDSKDNAYAALMQVTNCIRAHDVAMERDYERLVEEYENSLEAGRHAGFRIFCGIGLPIVLIRGKLFECYLDLNEKIVLSEIGESVVMVSSKDTVSASHEESVVSPIRIITEDLLEDYAQQMFGAVNALLAQDAALKEVWQYERDKLPQEFEPDEILF
ncbi:MAG TPA: hypothetical protein PKH77_25585 [Anaerolineae bacterium]|nr:hypothetical protein [Anaerolineae bacterium]